MSTAVGHGLHAAPWADARPGAHVARAAKFFVWTQAEAGHGCPVSMTYASVPALRHAARAGRPVRGAAGRAGLPAGPGGPRRQGRAAGRDGDDREAGRLGRAGQHHPRHPAGGAGQLPAHRPQVVLLGADVRPVPGPGPGAGGPVLLPAAARAARRQPERAAHPAAEGQAGEPVERLGRGRVRRRPGLAGRRAGPRHRDDHRDGHGDAAGLRAGQRRAGPPGLRHGRALRLGPPRVRRAGDRPPGDDRA